MTREKQNQRTWKRKIQRESMQKKRKKCEILDGFDNEGNVEKIERHALVHHDADDGRS